MIKLVALTVLISIAVSACSNDEDSARSGVRFGGQMSSADEFDENAARERAIDDLSYETYGSIGEPYGCTEDCEGHEAGFEWAKDNGITDGSCYGDSDSFNEGCQAYADAIEEKVNEYKEDDGSNY